MSMMERGSWDISQSSTHWKLYQYWRRLGGQGPQAKGRPIDLCHYMRVVCFWFWLRWFFCASWKSINPWMVPAMIGLVAINIDLFTHYPQAMWIAWIVVGIIALVVSLALAVFFVLEWWEEENEESFYRFWNGVGRPFVLLGDGLWWVLRKIGRRIESGVIWVAEKIATGLNWLWFKHLYPLLCRTIFWRFQIWNLLIPIPFALIWWVKAPVGKWFLIGTGIFLGVIAFVIGMAFLWEEVISPWLKERHDSRPIERIESDITLTPREPSQFRQFMRLIWMYLVARKQRICPFVTPRA